jgi:hypothetical protein
MMEACCLATLVAYGPNRKAAGNGCLAATLKNGVRPSLAPMAPAAEARMAADWPRDPRHGFSSSCAGSEASKQLRSPKAPAVGADSLPEPRAGELPVSMTFTILPSSEVRIWGVRTIDGYRNHFKGVTFSAAVTYSR